MLSWSPLDRTARHVSVQRAPRPKREQDEESVDWLDKHKHTLIKGLMSFSSAMVEGTVGRGGEDSLSSLHQDIFSVMACSDSEVYYSEERKGNCLTYLVFRLNMVTKGKVL